MKDLDDLKVILFNYVKEYNEQNKKLDNLISNKDIYEELIKNLSKCISGDYNDVLNLGICLETLYGNKYNNLLDYIFKSERLILLNKHDSDEYKELIGKIIDITGDVNDDYFYILQEIKEITSKLAYMKDKMIVSRRVISNLKFKQFINTEDIGIINKLLRELGYEDIDVSIIVEKLFVNNRINFDKKNGNYINYSEKNKFVNLMSIGGEIFDSPFVENEEKLNNYVNSCLEFLLNYNDEINQFNFELILPSVGRELKNNDELEYILINLLKEIRNELDDNINLLKDSEFIMNFEIKTDVAIVCYGLIEKYNLVRDYLDNVFYAKTNESETNDDTLIIDDVLVDDNNSQFLYLCKPSGESYFMSDIEDMNKEYATRAIEILNEFKTNVSKRTKSKPLANMNGLFEIKDDQIRIIYKRAPGDIYIIYAAIVKKEDRISTAVRRKILSRRGIVSNNSEEIEKIIDEYLLNNHRKWTR